MRQNPEVTAPVGPMLERMVFEVSINACVICLFNTSMKLFALAGRKLSQLV